jgi:hypothetical protein
MEMAVELAGHALHRTIMTRGLFVLRLLAVKTQTSVRKTRTEE